jgi:hypothetical protein
LLTGGFGGGPNLIGLGLSYGTAVAFHGNV